MFNLGLPRPALDTYLAGLAKSHFFNVRVQVLDLEHNPVTVISNRILGGQITVDWEGEDATRALTMTVLDPNYNLGFDTADTANGIWFLDRMVQVWAETWIPELGITVECPIFTGPVRKFKRSQSVVQFGCVGKDIFARQSWPRFKIPKGRNKVAAIHDILTELGETKFRFEATTTQVMGADKYIDRSMELSPWGYARVLAATMDMTLFYAGDGYAVLRDRTDVPVYTFRDGEGGSVLTEPDDEGDYTRLANVVRAEGLVNASGKNPAYEAMVDPTSPIYPGNPNLQRGGKPLYLGVVVIRDSITTPQQAKDVAKSELADRQKVPYSTSFDALPIFPLEEYDPIALHAVNSYTTTPLLKFAFGFRPADTMPVGYKKLIAPQVAQIRRY